MRAVGASGCCLGKGDQHHLGKASSKPWPHRLAQSLEMSGLRDHLKLRDTRQDPRRVSQASDVPSMGETKEKTLLLPQTALLRSPFGFLP